MRYVGLIDITMLIEKIIVGAKKRPPCGGSKLLLDLEK